MAKADIFGLIRIITDASMPSSCGSSARGQRDLLPDTEPPVDFRYAADVPVFFGHYWMNDIPVLTAPNAASLVADAEQIKKRIEDRTTRKALIDARLGQGQFRADVEKLWKSACAVTGRGIAAVLRASHIKPWSQSANKERLDPENGILLAVHIEMMKWGAREEMLLHHCTANHEREIDVLIETV